MTTTPHTGLDPVRDEARLRDIAELDLFAPEVNEMLTEHARRAAERFGLPISLVSIVLDDAQYLAGRHGVGGWIDEAAGTPVEWSFCANTVRTSQPFVVEDATVHPFMRRSPLVAIDGIRCYAGIPMVSANDFVLGSFCVVGTEARSFSPEEIDELRERAAVVVAELEARRRPLED